MRHTFTIETLLPAAAGAVHSGGPDAPQLALASEFGVLNQFLDIRGAGAAAAPAAPPEGLWRREVRELVAQRAFRPELEPANLYELREYSLQPGTRERFVEAMLGSMPVRERYSPNLCVWVPATGTLDRVVHLWPYRDLEHRAQVRAAVAAEDDWTAYLRRVLPWIQEISSTLWRRMPGRPAAVR